MTDPIADMITCIRNGVRNGTQSVTMPSSAMKLSLCEVLKREGYIDGFEIVEKPVQNAVKIVLRYGPNGERVITKIRRISSPGRRVYRGYGELKPVLRGLGIAVLSTPKGLLSDREAREAKVGGEILIEVH